MIKPNFFLKREGTILILALWALTLLMVFAVNIGMRIQQKLTLLGRLERKAQAQSTAVSAIRLARSRILANFSIKGKITPAMLKTLRHNNEYNFANMEIDQEQASVSYNAADGQDERPITMYGVVDEERKININKANADVLTALITQATRIKEEDAQKLAEAIVDWRRYGESEIQGFYSDNYYEDLEFPYTPKKNDFEVIEELQLVKGVTPEIYAQLARFVTVYGDGLINANTASRNVLIALGLEPLLADKVISLRNGRDGLPYTEDDEVFNSASDIPVLLEAASKLAEREVQQIQEVVTQGYLKTESQYYLATAQAQWKNSKINYVISCVFRSLDGKIISWREL